MRFLLVYHGGGARPGEPRRDIAPLWRWLDRLKSRGRRTTSFIAAGGSTVASNSVDAYRGTVFGISIIEAQSMDAALERSRDWPELRNGGRIEIFEELEQSRS